MMLSEISQPMQKDKYCMILLIWGADPQFCWIYRWGTCRYRRSTALHLTRNLSIHRLWYPEGSWELVPRDTEGQLCKNKLMSLLCSYRVFLFAWLVRVWVVLVLIFSWKGGVALWVNKPQQEHEKTSDPKGLTSSLQCSSLWHLSPTKLASPPRGEDG